MAIYAMSDIHGMYGPFMRRIKQLNNLETVKLGIDKLILLGDYMDVGNNSFKVLKTGYMAIEILILSRYFSMINK